MTSPFGFQSALESPGFALWLLSNRWQRHIREALAPLELTHVQFVLLASLLWLEAAQETVTQKKLADHAGTDVMMTSEVLRALEGRGFVQREAHPQDARAKALRLTGVGRARVIEAVQTVEAADAAFFGPLEGEGAAFLAQMQRLLEREG